MKFNLLFVRRVTGSPFFRMVVGIVVILLSYLAVQQVFWLLYESFTGSRVLVIALFQLLTSGSVLCTYYLLFRFYERRPVDELSLRKFFPGLLCGFLLGALLQSLVVLFIFLFGSYTVEAVRWSVYLVNGLFIGFSIAVFEEILMRGVVFRLAEEKLGTCWALILSAFIFGFLHLNNEGAEWFSAIAISLEAGLLLGAAYVYTRNLWFPIFLHLFWNYFEGNVYGFPVSGGEPGMSLFDSEACGPEWMTGGSFGPESSVQAVFFGLIAAIVLLVRARRKGRFIKPSWSGKPL